jgi:zinc protease
MSTAVIEATSRAARVQKVRSPGGIEAWLVEDYAVPLVALDFAMPGGAAQDPAGKAGVATLLSVLLDEGAGPYDSSAFHQAIDDLAVHLSFGADRDHFTGHLLTLTRNRDEAFELLRLALCDARLDAEPIERVRGQLIASLRRELNDPDSMAARALRRLSFPGHAYGRPVRGEINSLGMIHRDDLVAMRSKGFARDHLVIAVVGAINAATLGPHLDAIFGALPEKGAIEAVPPVTMAGVGSTHIETLDIPQSTLRFARPGLARKDPDFVAATVVNHILGGGAFTARLFREVREKRGLAYSVYSQLQSFDRAALVIGGTSTKNERAAESLDVIRHEIRDLADNGPTADELEKAKKFLIGSYALSFDTSTKIASQLVHLQSEGYDVTWLDERNRRVAAVTMEDAKRAAKRLFGDGSLLVAAAGKPVGL